MEQPNRTLQNIQIERPTLSLAHLSRTLHHYSRTIWVTLAAVAGVYLIAALVIYLLAPSHRVTSLHIRMDFSGASVGQYPNRSKFSPAELTAGPLLTKVFAQNGLDRYTTYDKFSNSIFILESNPAYEALAAEFRARLNDPKLTPVDRERILKDYELKRETISRAEFSINWTRRERVGGVPETIVRKTLADIPRVWAESAVREKHVLSHRVAVISPDFIKETPLEAGDPLIAIHVLRSKVLRAIGNVDEVAVLPAADLARTRTDRLSLADIRLQLEDIVRFRLEPMVAAVGGTNPRAIEFVAAQLAYDQRELRARNERVKAIREAMRFYGMDAKPESEAATASGPNGAAPTGDGVTPQLSESFIDRLVTLTNNARDNEFRQRIMLEYRDTAVQTIPLERAVAYDAKVLDDLRRGGFGTGTPHAELRAQLATTRSEVQRLMTRLGEIHAVVSENLDPPGELYTLTSPLATRTERGVAVSRLVLYGVLLLLVALPTILFIVLIHNMVREEEVEEAAAEAALEHERQQSVTDALPST